jgi:hypothetical protein
MHLFGHALDPDYYFELPREPTQEREAKGGSSLPEDRRCCRDVVSLANI